MLIVKVNTATTIAYIFTCSGWDLKDLTAESSTSIFPPTALRSEVLSGATRPLVVAGSLGATHGSNT